MQQLAAPADRTWPLQLAIRWLVFQTGAYWWRVLSERAGDKQASGSSGASPACWHRPYASPSQRLSSPTPLSCGVSTVPPFLHQYPHPSFHFLKGFKTFSPVKSVFLLPDTSTEACRDLTMSTGRCHPRFSFLVSLLCCHRTLEERSGR